MKPTSFGLECEFFIQGANGEFQLCPKFLPSDESVVLAEARGEPANTPRAAVFNLMAEMDRMHSVLTEKDPCGASLRLYPYQKLPRELHQKAARVSAKGLVKWQNMYGHTSHKVPQGTTTAAVHISFRLDRKMRYTVKVRERDDDKIEEFTYSPLWDYATLFRTLDQEFKEEIKKARRVPGSYELKDDGRIEYRSLPNDVNLKKVIKVLEEYLKS